MKRETVDGRVNNIFSDSDSGALLSSMSMLPCEYEYIQGCRYYEACGWSIIFFLLINMIMAVSLPKIINITIKNNSNIIKLK